VAGVRRRKLFGVKRKRRVKTNEFVTFKTIKKELRKATIALTLHLPKPPWAEWDEWPYAPFDSFPLC